ncbi:interferon regulatory factor 5 isoform X2 [Rhea pennata]|uniref:interferon regulatory factor 5 isoform X2 n=1 Tax=Rhea pennata TaxID=8795 RepID=UPI002E260018
MVTRRRPGRGRSRRRLRFPFRAAPSRAEPSRSRPVPSRPVPSTARPGPARRDERPAAPRAPAALAAGAGGQRPLPGAALAGRRAAALLHPVAPRHAAPARPPRRGHRLQGLGAGDGQVHGGAGRARPGQVEGEPALRAQQEPRLPPALRRHQGHPAAALQGLRGVRGGGRQRRDTLGAPCPVRAPLSLADALAEDDYCCVEEEDVNQLQKMMSLSIEDPQHGADLLPPCPWPKEETPFGSTGGEGPFVPLAPPALLPTEAPGALGPPPACPVPHAEQFIPSLLVSPHMLPLTDLEIKFQYRGRQVCALTISNPHGCRLFHSSLEPTQEQVELFGPLTLEQVRFPATDAIPNEKQRFYTHQLLDALDRGLILELQGQDLFAIRLCQCKVFWTGPCASDHAGPNPIEREKKTKLFSLEGFLNGLILFQKGQTTTPPPFEIFFCFGEEWPDQKPKEKKLITVQVVPVAARLLLEMFSGELSWSADSIPLQISHPDLKDRMVEQFKELHQLWQNQQRLPPAQPPGAAWALPQ